MANAMMAKRTTKAQQAAQAAAVAQAATEAAQQAAETTAREAQIAALNTLHEAAHLLKAAVRARRIADASFSQRDAADRQDALVDLITEMAGLVGQNIYRARYTPGDVRAATGEIALMR
jgi:type II secretory pathway pseudopilin PulG